MKFGLFYEISVPRPWTREIMPARAVIEALASEAEAVLARLGRG